MGQIRHVLTQQERRASEWRGGVMEVDGYRVKVRAKRNARNLATYWDDIFRTDSGMKPAKERRNGKKHTS